MKISPQSLIQHAFICVISCVSYCHGQTRVKLPIDFPNSQKTPVSVYVYKKSENSSTKRTNYYLSIEGKITYPQQIEWTCESIAESGHIEKQKICFILSPENKNIQSIDSRHDYRTLCLEKNIVPTSVKFPDASDIKPYVSYPDEGLIFIGDTIRLSVNTSSENDNLTWEWQPKDDPKAYQIGKEITVTNIHQTRYLLFSKWKGCDGRYLYSDTTYLPISVQDRNDFDFRIIGPIGRIPDTSNLTLTAEVTKDRLNESITWKWFKVSDGSRRMIGEDQIYHEEPRYNLVDTLYRACAYARGREVRCRNFRLTLNRLPSPGPFRLTQIDTVSCKDRVRVVASPHGPRPEKWIWNIDGQSMYSTSDTLYVTEPWVGKKVCAYPILNKRSGIERTKCIVLKACTKLSPPILDVIGKMFRCTDDSLSKFKIIWSSNTASLQKWVLYENGSPMRPITYGSDTVMLNPSKTTQYSIRLYSDTLQYFNFTLHVVQRPEAPSQIKGPGSVCPEEIFKLEIGEKYKDSTTWLWYRNVRMGQRDLNVYLGKGIYHQDKIDYSTQYSVYTEYKGCRSANSAKKTVVVKNPPDAPLIKKIRYRPRTSSFSIQLKGTKDDKHIFEWSYDGFESVSYTGGTLKDIRISSREVTIMARMRDECNSYSDILLIRVQKDNRNPTRYILVRIIIYRSIRNRGTIVEPRIITLPEKTLRVASEGEGDMFLNIGTVTNTFSDFRNLRFTVGRGRVYVSGMLNPWFLFNLSDHVKLYKGSRLDINAEGRVINYPTSTGHYYTVNGSSMTQRFGFTTGTLFNISNIKLHAGLGYGYRDVFWGMDMRSYGTNVLTSKVWGRSIPGSWRGLTMDVGLMYDFGKMNGMAGLQSIVDPDKAKPFIEFSIGAGIKLDRK